MNAQQKRIKRCLLHLRCCSSNIRQLLVSQCLCYLCAYHITVVGKRNDVSIKPHGKSMWVVALFHLLFWLEVPYYPLPSFFVLWSSFMTFFWCVYHLGVGQNISASVWFCIFSFLYFFLVFQSCSLIFFFYFFQHICFLWLCYKLNKNSCCLQGYSHEAVSLFVLGGITQAGKTTEGYGSSCQGFHVWDSFLLCAVASSLMVAWQLHCILGRKLLLWAQRNTNNPP